MKIYYLDYINANLGFIILGHALIIGFIVMLCYKPLANIKLLVITTVSVVLGIILLYDFYYGLVTVMKYNNLVPASFPLTVSVRDVKDENESYEDIMKSTPRLITLNQNQLSLENAIVNHREHVSYTDGYLIEFHDIKDETGACLLVFTKSINNQQQKNDCLIIIPCIHSSDCRIIEYDMNSSLVRQQLQALIQ